MCIRDSHSTTTRVTSPVIHWLSFLKLPSILLKGGALLHSNYAYFVMAAFYVGDFITSVTFYQRNMPVIDFYGSLSIILMLNVLRYGTS